MRKSKLAAAQAAMRERQAQPAVEKSQTTRVATLADEFFTPQEVAAMLRVSTDYVIARFESVPGVLDLGSPETRSKRRYRILRIPRSALNRFISESMVA